MPCPLLLDLSRVRARGRSRDSLPHGSAKATEQGRCLTAVFLVEGMENGTGSRVAVPAQRAQGPLWETAAQVCGLGRDRGHLFYVKCKQFDEFILGMRNSRHVPGAMCPRHMFMPVVHRTYPWQVALQQSPLPFWRDARSCSLSIRSL
jgi:hypothetical protein